LHGIRHLGGGPTTGIDFCSFSIGDFKYEVYAPPSASSIKVFRNKLVRNADGIIFIIPSREDLMEPTASFILELRRLLFDKYKERFKDFPIIYAINFFDGSNIDPRTIVEQLNLPENAIVYTFSIDSEKDVRELFAKITLLTSLRKLDEKSYYMELDKLIAETKSRFAEPLPPTPPGEIAPPVEEAPPVDVLSSQIFVEQASVSSPDASLQVSAEEASKSELNIMLISDSLKNKLLQNYINEVVIVDFDRSIGYIPSGYAFGTGKVVNYISDPSCLVELSIIAKHSMGFLLKDGFTFLGLVHLPSQGFIILETTSSHMKKMINFVKALKKVLSKYGYVDQKILLNTLDRIL